MKSAAVTNVSRASAEVASREGVMMDAGRSPFVRAGIVGAGLMGYWHARVIKRAGGELSAVVDSDVSAASLLTRKYKSAKSFSNLEQMLGQRDLDVLHICTPSTTHLKIAESAIRAGINTVIEKPVAPTFDATTHLFELAAQHKVHICPVHQFIFQDGVLQAKELINRIGQLIHMEGIFCSAGGVGRYGAALDTIVADILPHPLSLLQAFTPGGLANKNWVTMRPRAGEFRAHSDASGCSSAIFISLHGRPTQCSFHLVGTEGTIHMDLFHGYAFMQPGKVSKVRKIAQPFDLSMRKLLAASINLGQRVVRRESAYPGLQRLVAEFYRSLKTKDDRPIVREDALAVAIVRDLLIRDAGLIETQRADTLS